MTGERGARGLFSWLEEHARERILVGLDFDGTLAPLVPDRDRAMIKPRTREALRAVCARHPVAVVSGRSRADLLRRLGGLPVAHVVGNHGLELEGQRPPAGLDQLDELRARFRVAPRGTLAGVELEDKRWSLAFHVREADGRARRALPVLWQGLKVQVTGGKQVVNVLPLDRRDKGTAMLTLMRQERCRLGLFVGDDLTDERAFAAAPHRLVGVRVGRAARTLAQFRLRTQSQVDGLLAWLADFDPDMPGRRG